MIFVDSSFFIGLFDDRDQWHKRSLKILADVRQDTVVISEYIISEVMTGIGKRKGGKIADTIYHFFLEKCHTQYSNPDLFEKTEQTFLKYDGTISFVDAMSIRVIEKYGIKKIVSFDSDFDKVKGIERIH